MTAQRYKPLFERRRPGAYRISLCAIRYARGLVEVFHGDAGGQSRNKFVSTHFRYLGDALYREPLSPQHYRVAGFILACGPRSTQIISIATRPTIGTSRPLTSTGVPDGAARG